MASLSGAVLSVLAEQTQVLKHRAMAKLITVEWLDGWMAFRLIKRKNRFPARATLWEESMAFACLPMSVGLLWGPWFPPTPQRCVCEVDGCVYIVPV